MEATMAKPKNITASTPASTRKKPVLQPIRYSTGQVALALQVALLYSKDSLMDNTGHNLGTLRSMAAQKRPPSVTVLRYLRLTVDGSEYVWDPALEWKSNPCWGPAISRPSEETLANGSAIRLAVRNVETSFTLDFFTKPRINPRTINMAGTVESSFVDR
jgi:hypothetical protein